jgi:hypothetical protein
MKRPDIGGTSPRALTSADGARLVPVWGHQTALRCRSWPPAHRLQQRPGRPMVARAEHVGPPSGSRHYRPLGRSVVDQTCGRNVARGAVAEIGDAGCVPALAPGLLEVAKGKALTCRGPAAEQVLRLGGEVAEVVRHAPVFSVVPLGTLIILAVRSRRTVLIRTNSLCLHGTWSAYLTMRIRWGANVSIASNRWSSDNRQSSFTFSRAEGSPDRSCTRR